MSLVYRLMYLVGFTPWDAGAIPPELSDLVEHEGGLPAGRALDIGCGTGAQSVYLARHGWQVTGVDDLAKPLRQARARARRSGVSVDWVRGDAAHLTESGLAPGFDLVFDRGCFHGLNTHERAAYAAGVTQLASARAALLMMSFARNHIRFAPAGADETEVVQTFAAWELLASRSDTGPDPAGPLGHVPRRWYRFVRRVQSRP